MRRPTVVLMFTALVSPVDLDSVYSQAYHSRILQLVSLSQWCWIGSEPNTKPSIKLWVDQFL